MLGAQIWWWNRRVDINPCCGHQWMSTDFLFCPSLFCLWSSGFGNSYVSSIVAFCIEYLEVSCVGVLCVLRACLDLFNEQNSPYINCIHACPTNRDGVDCCVTDQDDVNCCVCLRCVVSVLYSCYTTAFLLLVPLHHGRCLCLSGSLEGVSAGSQPMIWRRAWISAWRIPCWPRVTCFQVESCSAPLLTLWHIPLGP